MTDIGPRDVTRPLWQWKWVITAASVLLCALILGGWQAGWWFATQNVQRQSNVIRLNYATQESYLSQVSGYIATIDGIAVQEAQAAGGQLAGLRAQALGIGNQACALVPQISIPLGADAGWVRANCASGAVKVTSPLRRNQ